MNQTTIAANGTTHHSVLNARMVEEYCRTLRMPTVGASFAQLAEEAVRTHQTVQPPFVTPIEWREINCFPSLI